MKRRDFLRSAGWVSTGLIFVPRIIRSQGILDAEEAAVLRKKAAGGGGASDTIWLTLNLAGTVRFNYSGTLGGKFTVSSPITVTQLGRYVFSGSTQTHPIGIWNAASPSTPVVSASLNTTGLPTGFWFVACSATVLTAGTYITGSQEFNSGDSWYSDDTLISTTGDATIATSGFSSTSGFVAPDTFQNAGVVMFVPPNFKYHL